MLRGLVQFIQPALVPLCFGVAWLFVGMIGWSIWAAIRDGVANAKTMHSIPCANCQFFTNSHYLKCPIHPKSALSPDAINCPDYASALYIPTLDSD
jgi:hypothetical protein